MSITTTTTSPSQIRESNLLGRTLSEKINQETEVTKKIMVDFFNDDKLFCEVTKEVCAAVINHMGVKNFLDNYADIRHNGIESCIKDHNQWKDTDRLVKTFDNHKSIFLNWLEAYQQNVSICNDSTETLCHAIKATYPDNTELLKDLHSKVAGFLSGSVDADDSYIITALVLVAIDEVCHAFYDFLSLGTVSINITY